MGNYSSRQQTDALDYMQALLGELRVMARAERCDMLAYLIEMAYVEASDIIRGGRPRHSREERLMPYDDGMIVLCNGKNKRN